MKVAIVANPFSKIPAAKYGGTETVIYHSIKGLIEAGHEPILIGTGDSEVDCRVIPIVQKAEFYPRNPALVRTYRLRVKRIHNRTERILRNLLPEIDVIHAHGFDLKPFANFPHVITLHNHFVLSSPSQGRDFFFNPLSLEYFKERKNLNYVSISENQRAGYPDLNYIGTVYNGEDPSKFPIIKRPDNYVCFLGRFDEEKAPHQAIELAINLGIKIKLAGKTDFLGYRYFRNNIKPYLDHPLVEYLGELGFDDKVKLLSHAKCNIHPIYFREPFGLTVLEAAYCGTPTLAISRGAMPELIEHGKTGMLVEDLIEGFHTIQECFKMDREYVAKRARKKFNHHNMTKGYLHAYRRAIKASQKP
jgi:glycosyltransferase involved in cell wall biosynthesis